MSDVGEALERYVHNLPAAEGDEGLDMGMMGDWISVVSMVRVNAEGQPLTQYYLVMRDGNMLPHIARGLLAQGLAELAGQVVELD